MDLRAILELASQGPFTPKKLSKALGISLSEAEAVIGALLSHGYIAEVKLYACVDCPLSSACKMGRGRIYAITEKGRKLLRENT